MNAAVSCDQIIGGDARRWVAIRVGLADRPGALGAVASRIGAVGADLVGVDVVERADGRAVDDLIVVLPPDLTVDLLRRELREVDGLALVHVRPTAVGFSDPVLAAVTATASVAAAAPDDVLAAFLEAAARLLRVDRATAFGPDGVVLSCCGLGGEPPTDPRPDDDVLETTVGPTTIELRRSCGPFLDRERRLVAQLGAIVEARRAVLDGEGRA
ncbi:MAG: hypothetical protein ACK5PP_13310 [Acidimicrobiales bacterium]